MHLAPLIHDLAVILGTAGIVSLIFKRIKQPVVLGYIIAGLLIGPHTPPYPLVSDTHGIQIWAELGVIFLMFSLGLEFSFRKLAKVGAPAGITAGLEAVIMTLLGVAVGILLGWNMMDSIFMGAMLSVSSTTIIIKALEEAGLKKRRFAEMIFAVLIVEDLLAILILVTLSTFALHSSISGLALLSATGKLVLVVGGWFLTGYFVVPRLARYVGKVGGDEMLTIVSLGLCLGLVVFSAHFKYSVALGAFIMGSILAESTESHRIALRIEPLKDVFAAVFFVSVGMLIDPRTLWNYMPEVALISAVTIIGKVLSTGLGALVTGQTLKTSVQVGFGLAQIGEFSFIIATLGMTMKATSDFIYPLGVAVSIVTTFTTPYMIKASEPFANWLERVLPRRTLRRLNDYTAWVQSSRTVSGSRSDFKPRLVRWLICALVVTLIFVVAEGWLLPWLKSSFPETSPFVVSFLCWLSAVLASAPFIWAMLAVFSVRSNLIRAIGFRLLTFLLMGVLSVELFPSRFSLLAIAAIAIVTFALTQRHLGASYRWFEKHFLSSFADTTEDHGKQSHLLRRLAPWDAHLVQIQVHPNSPFAAKRLADTQLRSRYGLNVVAIHRGARTIIAPNPDELVLPGDQLLVLAVDDQIEAVRPALEGPPQASATEIQEPDYELRAVRLDPSSPLVNRSVRESGIRAQYGVIVVGIERGGKRTLNPDPGSPMEAGDVIWLVGNRAQLNQIR